MALLHGAVDPTTARAAAYILQVERKIAEGEELEDRMTAIEEILKVSAAPGYSQHHTGGAADIASPGSRPLTEDFETSAAFGWLVEHAAEYEFSMTYPRDNAYGFIYEPWHWSM